MVIERDPRVPHLSLRPAASGYSLSSQGAFPSSPKSVQSWFHGSTAELGLVDLTSEGAATTQTRDEVSGKTAPLNEPAPVKKGLRFWAVIGALALANFMIALEQVIVSTALPTIVAKLDMGEDFVWVTSVNFLAR